MTTGKVWVYRKEGIPVGTSKEDLHQAFPIDIRHQIKVTSLSPGIDLNQRTLTATFSFDTKPGEKHLVSEDKDFYGFTPLYTPPADIETDIIAVTGLAGHAFGSWAASPNMWLRDFVPNDLPKARVLLYGYNSNLAGNQSKNIISDFSNNFVVKFHTMRNLSRSRDRPIVLIGHSLGCLIIKDALIEMSSHPIHLLCKYFQSAHLSSWMRAHRALPSTINASSESCHIFWRSTPRSKYHCYAVYPEEHTFSRAHSRTRLAISDYAEAQ